MPMTILNSGVTKQKFTKFTHSTQYSQIITADLF